ncbi:MAG: hypothetical protein WC337_06320 [Candidatus Muiribacteriota bacterium]
MSGNTSKKLLFFAISGIFMWLINYTYVIFAICREIGIKTINYQAIFDTMSYIIPFPYFTTLSTFYSAVFGFIFFMAGYQSYKKRISGFYWFISIAYMMIIVPVAGFIMFGTFLNFYSILFNMIFGILILYYFSSNEIEEVFDISRKLKKRLKKENDFFQILFSLSIIIYFIAILIIFNSNSSILENFSTLVTENSFYNNYFEKFTEIELYNIKIPLPERFIHGEIARGEKTDTVSFIEENYGIVFSVSKENFADDMYNSVGKIMGITNSSQFIEKLFNDKFGLFFYYLKLKQFSQYNSKEKFTINNTGFIHYIFDGDYTDERKLKTFFSYSKESGNFIKTNLIYNHELKHIEIEFTENVIKKIENI